jgi:hypothetical protein
MLVAERPFAPAIDASAVVPGVLSLLIHSMVSVPALYPYS